MMASGTARKRDKIGRRKIMEVMSRADAMDERRQQQAANQLAVINRLQDRLAERDAEINALHRHLNVAHAGLSCGYHNCEGTPVL